MVRKLGILLNYIILYSVCILISVNYGAKEHIVISEREDKINSIMKSSGYELNNERIKTGYTELTYTSSDGRIDYKFYHDYEKAKCKGLNVYVYMNYNDDVNLVVDTINKLTFKELSISYDDVIDAIEKYKMTNERQKLSNQEDFDKYGMYYVLSIYETTEENKDFNLNYIIVSR